MCIFICIMYSIHTHISINIYSYTRRTRHLIFHKGLPASRTALWQDRFQMNYSKFKTGNKNKLIKSLHVKFCHHIGQLLCSNRQYSTQCLHVSTHPCKRCWSRHPQLLARSLHRQHGGRLTASSHALASLPIAANITYCTVN